MSERARGLDALNAMDAPDAESALLKCCASTRWARLVAAQRPYATLLALTDAARDMWRALTPDEWRRAFAAHPRIGEATSSKWSASEQSGVGAAGDRGLSELRRLNDEYFDKFGYIFIVCATGLGGDQMLEGLRARTNNDPETELAVAAGEHERITAMRLEKLVAELGENA